jgi:hypothetical protein
MRPTSRRRHTPRALSFSWHSLKSTWQLTRRPGARLRPRLRSRCCCLRSRASGGRAGAAPAVSAPRTPTPTHSTPFLPALAPLSLQLVPRLFSPRPRPLRTPRRARRQYRAPAARGLAPPRRCSRQTTLRSTRPTPRCMLPHPRLRRHPRPRRRACRPRRRWQRQRWRRCLTVSTRLLT